MTVHCDHLCFNKLIIIFRLENGLIGHLYALCNCMCICTDFVVRKPMSTGIILERYEVHVD
jgi:hypothetical protein